MEAGYLLRIYQVRKTGYEGGLLKYPPSLYAAVCVLVDGLARLPSDEEIRLDLKDGQASFVVARSGVALATLPVGDLQNNLGGTPG
jgi:hypothetical protein